MFVGVGISFGVSMLACPAKSGFPCWVPYHLVGMAATARPTSAQEMAST